MLTNCNLLPAIKPNSTKVNNINTTKEILKAAMAERYEEEGDRMIGDLDSNDPYGHTEIEDLRAGLHKWLFKRKLLFLV